MPHTERVELLIYGLGHVGAAVAERARAFGASVIGCRRAARGDEPVDQMIGGDDLHDALPRADVVVLCAALNEGNHHVVDAAFLRALKADTVLVNVGRGGLIDEAALLAGLDRAQPSVAILDVFETEPLPRDSALWNHPRVRITAHAAGASPATSTRGDAIFLDNLKRFLDGEPLRLEVNVVETAP